jgi:hypothetical protein
MTRVPELISRPHNMRGRPARIEKETETPVLLGTASSFFLSSLLLSLSASS